MHLEIEAAVEFLVKVFSLKNTLRPDLLESLGKSLACLLNNRYKGHWYPEKPTRGQAYRCIRINPMQYVDESLLQACNLCGIEYSRLPLPNEITVWVDPFEVCGRLGEDTAYFTIATFDPVKYKEQTPACTEPETSDYASDGTSSELASENSSDEEETSGDETTKEEGKEVVPPTCNSPDEAVDSPSTSNAGTPVSELLALYEDTDESDAQEDTCGAKLPELDEPESSNAGTPVSELLASDETDGTNTSDAQEDTGGAKLPVLDGPESSNAGTPVSELLASDETDGTDASDAQEDNCGAKLPELDEPESS
ncbi:uncharacterized protein [Pyxicephalus adspersus]|uniref:Anti-proliferative protein domain-containing protein n=1 Tax=Pyxicephalus adspersus TaxID=30357 RepID=A0AAV2ZN88_PYXAD|nr:TPA: hypothetical protein GDO54_003303 [Pyxicephalus adspersus]